MNGRFWIVAGALLSAVAVSAGAIGTHVLKETLRLPESELQIFEVAERYQMVHALALILVGLLVERRDVRLWRAAGTLFLLGIALFSGGLYLWLWTGVKPLVHVVPFGGLAWIVGWLLLAAGAWTAPGAGKPQP